MASATRAGASEMRTGAPEMPTRELHDALELVHVLDAGGPLSGLRLQGLDLTASESALLARNDLTGLVVLGGAMTPRLAAHLIRRGAILFPAVPDAPGRPLPGPALHPHGALRRPGRRLRGHS